MNNRRNFLKLTGAGLTGSLLKPISSSAEKISIKNGSIKIGLLLPQSDEHPLLPDSFMNGIRLGLNQRNAIKKEKIEIVTENVNYGSPIVSKSKLQQLITENNVNLVVGLLNAEVSTDICKLVKNAQIPTIISNAGENYLNTEIKQNPYLFFNTLNLLENSYQAGKYAVAKFGKNISVVTSFYDSGYDALAAFYKGVESVGGINIKTYLKKQNDNDFISQTIQEIEKDKPDGIFVYLNGNLADEFFRVVHHKNVEVPTITSSFAVEDNRLVNLGSAANGIYNFSTWNKAIDNKENRIFVADYKKEHSIEPNQFAFLGYETGLITYHSLTACNGDFSGANLADAIATCTIKSPGGNIAVNKNSGMVSNPIYLCEAQPALFNLYENKVIGNYHPISEFDEVFKSFDSNMHSGWINPYLFV